MSIAKEMGLYRTARPRWNVYETDGRGRDSYISYNNGGFWNQNIQPMIRKPNYPIYHNSNYHSLRHSAAPFKYRCDGSGRDSYISVNDGGLKTDYKSLGKYHLKDFLRTPDSCIFNFQSNPLKEGVRIKTHYISKDEMNHNKDIKRVESGLINRLYPQKSERTLVRTRNRAKRPYNPYLRVHDYKYPRLVTENKYIEHTNNGEDLAKTRQRVLTLDKFEFRNQNTDPGDIYHYHKTHTVSNFFPKKKNQRTNLQLTNDI